jgi:hypothetical protein
LQFIFEGVLNERFLTGFGPFRKVTLSPKEFRAEFKSGEGPVVVNEDLVVECIEIPTGWLIQGSVRSVNCYFGEIPKTEPNRKLNIAMFAVADLELVATIAPFAMPDPAGEKSAYAA